MGDDPSKAVAVPSFGRVMRGVRNGEEYDYASSLLPEIIRAVMESGEAGSVTFKVTIQRDKEDEDVVKLTPKVTFSKPRRKAKAGIFFVDESFNPVRANPRQTSMELPEPAKPRPAVIDNETGERIDEAHLRVVGRGIT